MKLLLCTALGLPVGSVRPDLSGVGVGITSNKPITRPSLAQDGLFRSAAIFRYCMTAPSDNNRFSRP